MFTGSIDTNSSNTFIAQINETLQPWENKKIRIIPSFQFGKFPSLIYLVGANGLETGVGWRIIAGSSNKNGTLNTTVNNSFMRNIMVNDDNSPNYLQLEGSVDDLNNLFKTTKSLLLGKQNYETIGLNIGVEFFLKNDTSLEKNYKVTLIIQTCPYG